ncbi:MAG: YraN family protein [Acidobacteriota bacterium]
MWDEIWGEPRWMRAGQIGWTYWAQIRLAKPTLGTIGEWLALRHVRRLGWSIVARNWKGRRGEIDLIAYDGPCLVFIEVKARNSPSPLLPEHSITARKEEKLEDLAMQFISGHELIHIPVRIDLVAIEVRNGRRFRLRHYTSA